jgi:hypothetical protein
MKKFFKIINIVQHVIDLAKYLFGKKDQPVEPTASKKKQ